MREERKTRRKKLEANRISGNRESIINFRKQIKTEKRVHTGESEETK